MGLKPGYKRTEVGVISEDWEQDSIANLASITTGAKDTKDKVEDGAYPFFVRSPIVERIDSYSFDGEAVLTAGDGVGTGKVFHYIDGKFDFHQRVYKISDFSKDLDGYFFYSYFSTHFYNRIMSMTAKSSVDSVRMEMIADMKIPLPPLPEQRAIAAALRDVDTLVSELDRLIAKKRDIKQAAMQQLLTGKIRLPGFSREWEVKKLGEIAEIVMGQSPAGTSYNRTGHGYPLINGPTEFTDRYPIKIQWTTQPTKLCKKNDILLCVRGSSTGRMNISNDEYCIGRGVAAIRAKAGADTPFVTFQVDHAVKSILSLTSGSTFPNIDGKSIKSIELPLPPLPEQKAIAAILSDMDTEIAALEQRRAKTRALKQGMMQELLTGRIRLV